MTRQVMTDDDEYQKVQHNINRATGIKKLVDINTVARLIGVPK